MNEASGSFVMEFIDGSTLEIETIRMHYLPHYAALLRKIHGATAKCWMRRYRPIDVVSRQLQAVKERNAMSAAEIQLIEDILRDTEQVVSDHPWTPCHNDFHSQNAMLLKDGSLRAIDFEDCDLADPMWDVAYLAVNLEMEGDFERLGAAYGVDTEEKVRVEAYVRLAMAHCATWAARRGGLWIQHQIEVMERLKNVMGN